MESVKICALSLQKYSVCKKNHDFVDQIDLLEKSGTKWVRRFWLGKLIFVKETWDFAKIAIINKLD